MGLSNKALSYLSLQPCGLGHAHLSTPTANGYITKWNQHGLSLFVRCAIKTGKNGCQTLKPGLATLQSIEWLFRKGSDIVTSVTRGCAISLFY